MSMFTKAIVLIMVLVFIGKLDVYASVKTRINSVEMRLNYLEIRVNNDNIQTKSEFSSLEESVVSLNASLIEVNNIKCQASEEQLGTVQIIAQQSVDELSDLKRGEKSVTSQIAREEQWLWEELRTPEILFDRLNLTLMKSMDAYERELSDQKKEIDAISSQIVNLQTKQANLEKTVQKYTEDAMRVFLSVNGMIETRIKEENDKLKSEMIDELLFLNISIRKELFQQTSCLHGWSLFDRYCYYYDKNAKKTFSSARDYCRTLNAYIADFESSSESKFIYSLAGNVKTWAGVSDEQENNVWISERTNQTVAYTNWSPRDPYGGSGQRCVMLGYRYTDSWHHWIDRRCRHEYRFICKKEAALS